jgi:PHS family inorganic phosphate transporter-like MFS transporter
MTGRRLDNDPDESQRPQPQIQGERALVSPKNNWKGLFTYYSKWKNIKILLGTAGSWFLLDA